MLVGVRANNADALRLVQDYFPPGWKPSPATIVERLYSFVYGGDAVAQTRGVRRFNLLYRDIGRLARTRNAEEALEMFESDLQMHVATEAPRRVFVHAGVVGWKGQAILVPGRSYSGKTTLIAELIKAGATYYSDEYAVLDARGRVHPYPRPLQIRESETGKQNRYTIEKLGGRAGVKPLPVKLVIVSKYKPGARWRPRELSAGQGVLELLNQTVSARVQPGKAFATLQQVATQALILKGARGEAEEMIAPLFKYLES